MAAAQHVLKEICDASWQKGLLNCRRSLSFAAGRVQDTRRQSLTDELLELSQDPLNRKLICTDLLDTWKLSDLRWLILKLRGGECEVPGGGRRKADLIKAIIDVKEYMHRQGAAAAAAASFAEGPSISKGTCPSSFPPAPPGVQAVTEMALVPLDTSADPAKLKRKLIRKWRKKWVKFLRKKTCKADLKLVLQEVLVEQAVISSDLKLAPKEQMTVSDLRDIVGRRLGFLLEGRHRVAFDKALLQVTAKAPAAKRPQKRFKLAARSIKKRRG